MALNEVTFLSHDGRDEIRGWIYSPVRPARGIVQIAHGLGEHSRRYLHMITTLLDAGFAVAADDHAGHGATAMASGVWQDTGPDGVETVVVDEKSLHDLAVELHPGLPFVFFGHSWGSMIARGYASRYPEDLAGLALCGIAAGIHGIEQTLDREALDAAIAAGDGTDPDTGFQDQMFDGFTSRCGPDAGPTAWVAADPAVVADHGVDPLNNFGAPMSLRFVRDFALLYDRVNDAAWPAGIPADLPVLILAGEQDPVANYGEGALKAANQLWDTGHEDVETRIYSGVRHEVHNEPATRERVEADLLAFVERVTA
ncbi:alpha/beta fold hydrolase [Acidipropionibacterium virtanenii]|uniref:Monoacylglycerol lipase n=1 Tax=Acidipropionibacterium virtanenii TaxID=2057246 RepID=A0A344UQ49_9ACTN|nr:alpha/beta hydrolase [Acidipropionibacterium virtanenii]AXE37397.1 Monoacylglycerol lipase [Acidipropionibacterium virtanenii]